MSEENTTCNSDSCADAKAAIALMTIFVVTVCFFLVGGGKPTLVPVYMIGAGTFVAIVLAYLFSTLKK